jgi:hypothetical protein
MLFMGGIVNTRLFSFVAGEQGPWRIVSTTAVAGEPLPPAPRLDVRDGATDAAGRWTLRDVTSNERYVTRAEKTQLAAKQQGLGRASATCAALIPIRKTAGWWNLTQDERRAILEERSQHTRLGLQYLPAVARRLHHCRDLGTPEPFDFITWFEFAPADAAGFDRLVAALRTTEEWQFVEREVDIRLIRESP